MWRDVMSGKVVSLFAHPEFVRRNQARAERALAELVAPVIDLGRGRHRCRRCCLDFDGLPALHGGPNLPACPRCDSAPDFAAIEAFLAEISSEQ